MSHSKFIAASILLLTSLSTPVRAETCPSDFTRCNAVQLAFWSTVASVMSPFFSTADALHIRDRKVALAHAALEDAAVYFDTGRLTGILPVLVPQIREALSRENALEATDAEAVEAIVSIASE